MRRVVRTSSFDAQLFFQCIQPPAHDGRGHALNVGGRREAAPVATDTNDSSF